MKTQNSKLKALKTAVIALVVFSLFCGCSAKKNNGNFENTSWGMTVAEVNTSTKRLLTTGAEGTIVAEKVGKTEFFSEKTGIADSIVYYFDENGGLCQVLLSCSVAPGASTDDLIGEIKKNFDAEYDYDSKKNNTYLWNTKTGSITLFVMNNQLKICFSNTES